MTKRVQRGIRQQTEYMTAVEYDKVKNHNMAQNVVVKLFNQWDMPISRLTRMHIQCRVDEVFGVNLGRH